MPKLTRKSVRSEIVKAGVSEDKANELLESIMSMYGASTADMVSKEDLEELKQEAVNEAMKNTKKVKVTKIYQEEYKSTKRKTLSEH